MADVPVPSTATALWEPIIAGMFRHILTAAAGAGFIASAYDTDSTAHMLAGMAISAAVQGGTMAWSWWQKHQAAKTAYAGAVASANAGKPLQVPYV